MKNKALTILKDLSLMIIFLIVSTILGALFRTYGLHETNVVVVYIFSVLLIARFTRGYFYGIAASVISLLLFNWFFTEPYFTLKVHDMTYLITFAIMVFGRLEIFIVIIGLTFGFKRLKSLIVERLYV